MQVQRHGGVLALCSSRGRGLDGMLLGRGVAWSWTAIEGSGLAGAYVERCFRLSIRG